MIGHELLGHHHVRDPDEQTLRAALRSRFGHIDAAIMNNVRNSGLAFLEQHAVEVVRVSEERVETKLGGGGRWGI